jgi:hypothetical protein
MPTEAAVLASLPDSGFLRDYVLWAKDRTDGHLAYHVACALPIIAQTIPPELYFPTGSRIHSNLFSLIVGDSTKSRKTTCVEFARDILSQAAPAAIGPEPGSHEAQVDNLALTPRQLLIYSEFGNFLAISTAERYLHSLRTLFTKAYDCTPLSRSRVKKAGKQEITPIHNPRLSLLGAVTPQYLEEYTTPSDWNSGFLARFFTIEATRERSLVMTYPDQAMQETLAQRLASYTDVGVIAGVCQGFTPEATLVWREQINQLGKSLDKQESTSSLIRAAITRAPTMALKIALILAWDLGYARQPEGWWMPESIIQTATTFISWHLESVMKIGSRLAPSKDMRDRRTVLDAIPVDGRVVPLSLVINRSRMLKRRVIEILDTLITEELISVDNSGSGYFRIAAADNAAINVAANAAINTTKAEPSLQQAMARHPDDENIFTDTFGNKFRMQMN